MGFRLGSPASLKSKYTAGSGDDVGCFVRSPLDVSILLFGSEGRRENSDEILQ